MALPHNLPLRMFRNAIIALSLINAGLYTFIYIINGTSGLPPSLSTLYEQYLLHVPHLVLNSILFFVSLVYFKSNIVIKHRRERSYHLIGSSVLAVVLLVITVLALVRIKKKIPGLPGKNDTVCEALDKMSIQPCTFHVLAGVLEIFVVVALFIEAVWTRLMPLLRDRRTVREMEQRYLREVHTPFRPSTRFHVHAPHAPKPAKVRYSRRLGYGGLIAAHAPEFLKRWQERQERQEKNAPPRESHYTSSGSESRPKKSVPRESHYTSSGSESR